SGASALGSGVSSALGSGVSALGSGASALGSRLSGASSLPTAFFIVISQVLNGNHIAYLPWGIRSRSYKTNA
ncbi:MAG: hypothetical protein EBS33_03985, partial [Alphaproteobacteria bacterium]|nr:hypothetical protein [Alphaproteobacteria bacterium]